MLQLSALGFVEHSTTMSGYPEIPDNHSIIKFTFDENIANVLGNGLLAFAKQPRHMILSQPDRLVFQPDINSDVAVGSLVNKKF